MSGDRKRERGRSPRTEAESQMETGGRVEVIMEGKHQEAREAEDTSEAVEVALLEALAAALKEAGERQAEAMRHVADTIRVSS
jgi:uncharacterized membrane protein YqiK